MDGAGALHRILVDTPMQGVDERVTLPYRPQTRKAESDGRPPGRSARHLRQFRGRVGTGPNRDIEPVSTLTICRNPSRMGLSLQFIRRALIFEASNRLRPGRAQPIMRL